MTVWSVQCQRGQWRSLDRPDRIVTSSARASRKRQCLSSRDRSQGGSKHSTFESIDSSSRLKPHFSRLLVTFKRARDVSGRACSGIRVVTLGAARLWERSALRLECNGKPGRGDLASRARINQVLLVGQDGVAIVEVFHRGFDRYRVATLDDTNQSLLHYWVRHYPSLDEEKFDLLES